MSLRHRGERKGLVLAERTRTMVGSWAMVGQRGVGCLVGTTSRRHSLVPTVRPGAHGNNRIAIGARNT
jgi:hypothetical protein